MALMERDEIVLDEIEDEDQRTLTEQRYREEAVKSLNRNGYKVHLTIDKEIFDTHNEVVKNYDYFGDDVDVTFENEQGEKITRKFMEQTSSVLQDNRTGKIISFVAGRDFQQSQVNYATYETRHTGSTMKPLLTYGVGFETGLLQPGFITPDVPTFYPEPEDDKEVTNFGNSSHMGLITAREALQRSRNTPAVREFKNIDYDIARESLIKMGFEPYFVGGEPFPGTPLGTISMTNERNTNAFSLFGNEGKRADSYMIDRIEDSDGNVIFEHETDEIEVFSPQLFND